MGLIRVPSCSSGNLLSMLADRNFLASIQFALRRSQYQSQKPAGVSGSPSRILREERSFMSSRLPIFASSSEARTATLQSLLIAAIVITGLYVAREVLLPLALAILLSFVLTPALLFLRRLKIPRVVGVAIVVAFAFALIFSLGWTMSKQATQLAEDLPRLSARARRKNQRDSQIGDRFPCAGEGHRSDKGPGTRARQPKAGTQGRH